MVTRKWLHLAMGIWLLFVLGNTAAIAQTPRILLTGDSWGAYSNPVWPGQFNGNGWPIYSRVNSSISGMTAAGMNTPSFLDSMITQPLLANPSIDMVHLSIGGNDFLGNWKAYDPYATQLAHYSQIQNDVAGIVNHILSIRPDIQVTIASYDYLNLFDTVIANPFGPPGIMWNFLGQPNPRQLNVGIFGDGIEGGSILGLEDFKMNVAQGSSRVQYSNIEGFMQTFHYGLPPNLDFPTPTAFLADNGADPIHLNAAGYNIYVDHAFNTVYNNLFSGPTMTSSPAADGTVQFGPVLVGMSGDQNISLTNTGLPGSRLDAEFGSAGGIFSGGGQERHAFVDQWVGGDTVSETYTFAPTQRGASNQAVTINTNIGNFNVNLAGQGVAPVQSIDETTLDAGLVRVGTSTNLQATIENIGDGNLSGLGAVSNLQGTVDSPTGPFSGSNGPFSLPDSGTTSIDFTYAPTARGMHTDSIFVNFTNGRNDGTNQAQNVALDLQGQAVGPVYGSTESPNSTIDLGTTPFGSPLQTILGVSNNTTDPDGGNSALTDLTILGYSITGPNADDFSLVWTGPMVLSALESENFSIQFSPLSSIPGLREATLMLMTDEGTILGSNGETFSYFLSATVAIPEPTSVMLTVSGVIVVGLMLRRRSPARKTARRSNC